MAGLTIALPFVLLFLITTLGCLQAVDDSLLFTVIRPPRYFGILQDHRGQPLTVEHSDDYMDQDYLATNRKRHKINWNMNPLEIDDDTEEMAEDKDTKILKKTVPV